jgi:hypothetical protein
MICRPVWLVSGIPVIAILIAGCSETTHLAPPPPADGAKPPPIYSEIAQKTKITSKVQGKRPLNITGPSPGKLHE